MGPTKPNYPGARSIPLEDGKAHQSHGFLHVKLHKIEHLNCTCRLSRIVAAASVAVPLIPVAVRPTRLTLRNSAVPRPVRIHSRQHTQLPFAHLPTSAAAQLQCHRHREIHKLQPRRHRPPVHGRHRAAPNIHRRKRPYRIPAAAGRRPHNPIPAGIRQHPEIRRDHALSRRHSPCARLQQIAPDLMTRRRRLQQLLLRPLPPPQTLLLPRLAQIKRIAITIAVIIVISPRFLLRRRGGWEDNGGGGGVVFFAFEWEDWPIVMVVVVVVAVHDHIYGYNSEREKISLNNGRVKWRSERGREKEEL
ncbi:ATP-dependent RNA helicase rok1 [Striga asiatica]|uniref:ATP-dependent RNA helicase rok1 n=1 Tax=Striga asiatica TaxID=4170 RepID=A0A5A7P2T1_STRAF|nr:ATP-dependent RNA helicase rok1 [Striga asiatica]